ncbi:Maf-like protein [Salinimicrobium oceani]|uniref:dTTP/UTP pyrophosphatase n=1 Tax=Salinimicrobium oceani TaxID=2722702 RepID=A0ABX1CWA0_9FLAO|nr:Maf-like protein [Salinimicrobium oceani]NJW52566.1 septum formation protein Maf [Salinimicrobium oceani]
MLQEKLKDYHIILASASPRRQQFFREMGLDFEIRLKPVEEVYSKDLKGVEITNYLAQLKAEAFKEELRTNDILVTSDTIVWQAGAALEKPVDPAQALQMLRELSGKTHEVITSVCFTTAEKQKTVHAVTRVTFSKLEEDEMQFYIDNFRPFDKAGGYGIQEWIGLIGVEHLEGSYFNVVGLPTHLVYQSLKEMAE